MATYYSNDVLRARPDVETLAAAKVLTGADSGKTYILDAAVGYAITLPALPTEGEYKFTFVVGSTFITSDWVVSSSEGDNINGIISDMGTTVAGVPAAAEDNITFELGAEAVGDWVEFVSDSGNSQWLVRGVCANNGGITANDPA
jgi:hypothetical protein